MSLPPDGSGDGVEFVLVRRSDEFLWSLRIDGWSTVVAASWHGLAALRSIVGLERVAPGEHLIVAEDVRLLVLSDGFVEVQVPPGPAASARHSVLALSSAAKALLERAAAEQRRDDRMEA